jgi:predicted nucleic acid-binding protein
VRYLFDTNVLLDVILADPQWLKWSTGQLRRASANGEICINPIIYAELAPAFQTKLQLDRWLRPSLFRRLPLPYEAGFRAAEAFQSYRKRGGDRRSPLPDFYIGAHAEVESMVLVTRDQTRYETYFPNVKLQTPHPR